MAANSSSDDEGASQHANADRNSLFNGAHTPAQLAAGIGRCLQSLYQASLAEPMSDELADLVRQLQEQEERADLTA